MKNTSDFEVTNVDHIFHEIMHSNISIETGITKCSDGKEVSELIRLLATNGMINETSYDRLMTDMSQKGLLDRFIKKGEN